MLDMESKKHKYQYAEIKNGKAVDVKPDVLERLDIARKESFRDVGLYATGTYREQKLEQIEGDYRELRVTLKTNARLTGRGSKKKEYLPLVKIGGGTLAGEVYPKTVARFMSYIQYIVQYKPPYKKGEWHIDNSAEVCRFLGIQYRTYVNAVGYLSSKSIAYIDTRGGHIYYKNHRKLVEITAKMRSKFELPTGKGFVTQKQEEILDKNSTVDTIILKPTDEFFNGLGLDRYGKQLSTEEFRKVGGLGNVLLPIQSIRDSGEESLMEFKLRNFFISNTPRQRYKLDTLLAEGGITAEDIKKQGKPRYKKLIELELNKLQNRELIKYSYSNKTKVYNITVTKKAYSHPHLHKWE